MRTRSLALILVGLMLSSTAALTQGDKTAFDGRAAFDIVKTLAADGMIGRKAGEPGGRMGTDYIVGKLREWGLEPAGAKGTYLQDLTIEYYEVARGATLAFTAHDRTRGFVYGEDWRQYTYSGSGPFAGPVAFVGYGISAPQKGYDDYAGVDVAGKLVLFAVETPRRLEDRAREEAQFQQRVKAAQSHGARGALTFRSDGQAAGAFFRGNLRKDIYKPGFLIISLESRVVDFLFKWQKADPRYFFQQIEQTGTPQSYDLGVQALAGLHVMFDEARQTENVLAKIPGRDPKLAGEYVIVGAHMDHLGVDMTGDVLNGADDNASGTAVVLEAARVLKAKGFAPARTIVFALWGAEEEGLLGSKYYTEHPIYPIDKTVAVINLDMEGHGTGKVRVGGAYYAPEAWTLLKGALPKPVLDDTLPNRGGPGGSDHTHFLYNGVPAFMVSTDGPHFKTNRVGDVIDLIKPEILKKSGDFVVSALEALSTDPKLTVLPSRKETFYWRYETMINHQAEALDAALLAHKDVQDPDVDMQLASVGAKAGGNGDALRLAVTRELLSARERVAKTAGLVLFGSPAPAGAPMMGPAGPSKTTLLLGLNGVAALRGEPRWAEVFARQGLAFVQIDQPSAIFSGAALTEDGRKIVEAIGDANLLLIAKGLDSAQAKALLAATRKPIVLHTTASLSPEVLDLVKATESTVGLVLGSAETAAAFAGRLDAARKVVGAGATVIVTESSLWQAKARTQMLGVFGELLKAGYTLEELVNVTSGAFTRALNRARSADPIRRPPA
jgi:aminopeptidase YwaD